jgi:hypothetical protein
LDPSNAGTGIASANYEVPKEKEKIIAFGTSVTL